MENIRIININLYVVLFLFSVFLSTFSRQCFNNCDCLEDEGRVRLHCNGRNLTFFPLAPALLGNITIINYQDNKIQRLPKQPLGLKRTKVWSINLADNVIDTLLQDYLGETFPNLLYLYLSNNKISSLSENSFKYLKNLKGLYLASNKLKTISQGWFSSLLQLSYISLKNNEISVIEETTEIWPKLLSILDLSYNKLKVIPPLPPKASKVNIVENPIFCGCYLNVNKNISGISIKVNCYSLEYREIENKPIQAVYRETKYEKYVVSKLKCEQPKITNFTYLVVKGQVVLRCLISYGYPEPSVTVIYGDRRITKSRNNVTLDVTEPGMYTCKITNYISSDQRQLFTPELPVILPVTSEVMTTSDPDILNTENDTGSLDTTLLDITSHPKTDILITDYDTGIQETTLPDRTRQPDTEDSVGKY